MSCRFAASSQQIDDYAHVLSVELDLYTYRTSYTLLCLVLCVFVLCARSPRNKIKAFFCISSALRTIQDHNLYVAHKMMP